MSSRIGRRAARAEKVLQLAFSPCPNDTYVFHAWVKGLIDQAPAVEERLEDIDSLNRTALAGEVDVVKVSFYALGRLLDDYALLHAGGAMGRGCGPLVVARKDSGLRPAPSVGKLAMLADELASVRVAIPGELTTAALLVALFTGGLRRPVIIPFDRIMQAVAGGEVDAGVIIHEGRFTFGSFGLRRLIDLGEWWEETSSLPLPLGGIAVARSLGTQVQAEVERTVRASLEHAWSQPEAAMGYVRSHAQEMDPAVCAAHIALYVNDFTSDYGEEGERAIRRMLDISRDIGFLPPAMKGLFWDE